MARAAGIGLAVELSSSALKASAASHTLEATVPRPLQLPLLTAKLRSSSVSRFPCLAPSALYSEPSKFSAPLNSSAYRASEYQSLGFSALVVSSPPVRSAARAMAADNDLEAWIKETNSREPVVVYSKSWCPYCNRVKKLFGSLGYDIEVIELDQDGQPGLQEALESVSGQYTVPNVFIGGKHIGGCDDTVALHSRGALEPLLQAAYGSKN